MDYAYLSQFFSNGIAYIMTERGNISNRFSEAKYEPEVPQHDILNCLNRFQTTFDDSKKCRPNDRECQEKKAKSACPDEEELNGMADKMMTNKWKTGQVWGDVYAKLFNGSIDAPA